MLQVPTKLFYICASLSVVWSWSWVATTSATSNKSRYWEKNFFIEYSTACRGKTSPPQFTGSPYVVRYVPKASFWECSYALSTSQAFPVAPRSHDHVTFQLHSVALTFLSSSYFPILPFKATPPSRRDIPNPRMWLGYAAKSIARLAL